MVLNILDVKKTKKKYPLIMDSFSEENNDYFKKKKWICFLSNKFEKKIWIWFFLEPKKILKEKKQKKISSKSWRNVKILTRDNML